MDRKNIGHFSLEISELEAVTDASLWNYGTFREHCIRVSHKFEGGKAYGIICECGAGGWALTYTLAGRQQHFNGSIKINGIAADYKMLAKYSCYIGEGVAEEKGLLGIKNTIIKQIKNGIKSGESNFCDINEVIKLFSLENEISRLNRSIYHISNFRWAASIVVGYSYGKMIYCFPWLNTGWVKFIRKHIDGYINILKEKGAIVLIPTPKEESIKNIVDDVIYIKGSLEDI